MQETELLHRGRITEKITEKTLDVLAALAREVDPRWRTFVVSYLARVFKRRSDTPAANPPGPIMLYRCRITRHAASLALNPLSLAVVAPRAVPQRIGWVGGGGGVKMLRRNDS